MSCRNVSKHAHFHNRSGLFAHRDQCSSACTWFANRALLVVPCYSLNVTIFCEPISGLSRKARCRHRIRALEKECSHIIWTAFGALIASRDYHRLPCCTTVAHGFAYDQQKE